MADALGDGERGPEPTDSARAAAPWVAASARERGEALRDLLLLADRLPPPRTPAAARPQFPRIASGHARVHAALAPLGVADEVDEAAPARDGQCRWWWGRTPVDLFFAYDELHDAMRRDARTVPFGEDTIAILSPEHLTVCKTVFDRPKDWLDVEQILVCEGDLDVSEIERWLTRVAGPDDRRTQRFSELAAAVRAGDRPQDPSA